MGGENRVEGGRKGRRAGESSLRERMTEEWRKLTLAGVLSAQPGKFFLHCCLTTLFIYCLIHVTSKPCKGVVLAYFADQETELLP